MPDIEIKRGYEVLPDNNVRFGIRVTNNSDSAILDFEVILDYNESLFYLEGHKIQKLGTIPPSVPRTAKYILKPLGCIHKENVGATIIYKDHKWKKHTEEMNPKEVHCVCPFLKEKIIKRSDFLTMSKSGYFNERGVNFEGIKVEKLVEFISHTCKNRLYKVDEFPIDNGKIIYLAGDALGDKAYYLLTAVVKEYEGLTQVLLRANSDKNYGLNGFLIEILDNLRHLVVSASAREIGIIRKEHVINIIDSVVTRPTFEMRDGMPSVDIKGSVVTRPVIKTDHQKNKRDGERLLEEQERLRRQKEEEETAHSDKEEQAHQRMEKKAKRQGKARGETNTPVITAKATPPSAVVVTSSEDQKTITNSIGMEFVQISAGEFDMGSPPNESGRFDAEGPVHHVKISNAFYMGKYEVTQKQWRDVMGSHPSKFKGGNHPVESVSWDDVQDFIKKLNEKEGGSKYRLPSEAEWEYAARAGTKTRYSFGYDESKLGDYAWYSANSGRRTHKVGQKKPNPWGLYDMHGNVYEWVKDIYHNSYSGAPSDGSAWEGAREESGSNRVNRGGYWYFSAGECRSADRSNNGPVFRSSNIGFRLLREE